MKKRTALQILSACKNKPNVTVGMFSEAIKKAGYTWISGNSQHNKFFFNGNITLLKDDTVFSYTTFNDALDAAISNEQNPEAFKESNAGMQKAIRIMVKLYETIENKVNLDIALTAYETYLYKTHSKGFHLNRTLSFL